MALLDVSRQKLVEILDTANNLTNSSQIAGYPQHLHVSYPIHHYFYIWVGGGLRYHEEVNCLVQKMWVLMPDA